uniref:Ionotropic glutamate receptor C-terminal domain-containing protein n=1 Tax=Lygus hesperus TaxID=30085 RepID=A0A0K8SY69_LYGHE
MNLTLKYVKPLPGPRIGNLINGTWRGGIIGNVYSGSADIAFCGNWIESSKINTGIQVSVPVQRMCINYLVPRPKRRIGNWYAIFSPFSGSLWALLGVTLLVVSWVLNLMSLKMKILIDCRAKFYESKSNALLAMFGILVQGSWPSSKGNHGPARQIITGWVVFGLLMSTSFSSTLVSHLAKPKFDKKPEGIRDLVEMGYIWTENSPFPAQRLLNMEDSYNKKWADSIKIVGSMDEKIEDLRKDRRVIIGTDLWGGFATFSKRAIPSDVLSGYETMAGEPCCCKVKHHWIQVICNFTNFFIIQFCL